MVQNPPEGYPRVSPYLCYPDGDEAVAWLQRCFGFSLRMQLKGPDGKVAHAELVLGGDGVVMIGCPGADFRVADKDRPECFVHVYVDDLDAHHDTAKAAGAEITSGPENTFYGDRRYMVKDCGGHHWTFSEHVHDVDESSMEKWWESEPD